MANYTATVLDLTVFLAVLKRATAYPNSGAAPITNVNGVKVFDEKTMTAKEYS